MVDNKIILKLIGLDVPEDAVANVSRHVEYDPNDKTTMYSYSVMFYVTAKALENIADLDGFIDQVLAYTNQGKYTIFMQSLKYLF